MRTSSANWRRKDCMKTADMERRLAALEEWARAHEIGHVEGRALSWGPYSSHPPVPTLDDIHNRDKAAEAPPVVPLQPGDPGFFN
jgi:hypothetical protein